MFISGEARVLRNFTAADICGSLTETDPNNTCISALGNPLEQAARTYCAESSNHQSSFCRPGQTLSIQDIPNEIRDTITRGFERLYFRYNNSLFNIALRFFSTYARFPSITGLQSGVEEQLGEGTTYIMNGQFAEAISIFEQMIEIPHQYYQRHYPSQIYPDETLEGMGVFLFEQGNYEIALRALSASGRNEFPEISTLCSAMANNPNQYQMSDLTLSNEIHIRTFNGTGIDYHIFYYHGIESQLFRGAFGDIIFPHNEQVIIRGNADIVWQDARHTEHIFTLGSGEPSEQIPENADLAVSYPGSFGRVLFKNFTETIAGGGFLLNELLSRRDIPQTLFSGVNAVEFIAEENLFDGNLAHYDNGIIRMARGAMPDSFYSMLHEMGHGWEAAGGRSFVPMFRRISWNLDNPEIPIRLSDDYNDFLGGRIDHCGSNNCSSGPQSSTLNINTDTHQYGMENPKEDLATVIGSFYEHSTEFRQSAREQMQNRNFELAIKYLFARYCVYEREYRISSDSNSLGISEVRNTIYAAIAERPAEQLEMRRLLEIIEEIEVHTQRFASVFNKHI